MDSDFFSDEHSATVLPSRGNEVTINACNVVQDGDNGITIAINGEYFRGKFEKVLFETNWRNEDLIDALIECLKDPENERYS